MCGEMLRSPEKDHDHQMSLVSPDFKDEINGLKVMPSATNAESSRN